MMTFSIIGSGNMAWFLATRLHHCGIPCAGIYGRNEVAVKELSTAINSHIYQSLSAIPDDETHVCFLTVSDSSITDITDRLRFQQTTLVHTSGMADMLQLQTASSDTAVLWPIYSLSKNNLPNHRQIPCAWQATTEKSRNRIRDIGMLLTDILFETSTQQRRWMHLAAVVGNNFINHLLAITEQICSEQQLPFNYLQPILQETFQQADYKNKQTGPARRGDNNTMQQHLQLLAGNEEWQSVYKALSASIEKMYKSSEE